MLRIAQTKYQRFPDPDKDLFKLALMFVGGNMEEREKERYDEGKGLFKEVEFYALGLRLGMTNKSYLICQS